MKLKSLICLLLLLSMMQASYAGERERWSLSLSPYLSGGIMGIKDTSFSPLAYNGPFAGIGLCFSAYCTKTEFFVDASGSYGWLGNQYHWDPSSMQDGRMEISIGGKYDIYDNSRVSAKAGGAIGYMQNNQFNWQFTRYFYTFAFDAKACFSAELKLPRRWSVLMEDRIPFVAFISPSNTLSDGIPDSEFEFTFKAFPGNDFKIGVARTFASGNSLMLFIRHCCYSSGKAFPECFRQQFLEMGIAFRFGITKQ